MKTQKEIIEKGVSAYIIELSSSDNSMGTTVRYSIYVQDKEGNLTVLWASDSEKGKNFNDKLPYQVYSTNKKYPAFHFKLNGCGYSKTHSLATDVLRDINPDIKVYILTGWMPSPVSL